jgi:hypothetical protein
VSSSYTVYAKWTINNVEPTVTTPTATGITATSATLGANVTSLGVPASISARGTCWGTSPSPTTNCTVATGTTTGVFTHSRTGLTAGTLYYYRGYATNTTGTGYSADGTFTTIPAAPTWITKTATACDTVSLSWNTSAGATTYQLYRQGGSTPIQNSSATTFTDTGRTGATTYNYIIHASNASGESGDSTVATVTTPACACDAPLTQNVTVACDPNSYGYPATSGLVTRSQTKTAYPECLFPTPVTVSNSIYVSDTCVWPTDVISLIASPSSMNLPTHTSDLTWSMSSGYSPDSCFASTSPASPITWSGSKSKNGGTDPVTYPSSVATYTHTLECSKAGFQSSSTSATVVIKPIPNVAPNAPTIEAISTNFYKDNQLQFSFTATDPDDNRIRYEVDWDNDNNVESWLPSPSTDVASGTLQSELWIWSSTGDYSFKARTVDENGGLSGWTTYSLTISDQPDPPTITINISSVNIDYNEKVTFNWSTTGPTDYCNFYKVEGASEVFIKTGVISTYITPSLTANTTYILRCSGPGGPSSKLTTIQVGEINPIFEER